MTVAEIFEYLKARFPQAIVASRLEAIDPWIEVLPVGLLDICRTLRDDAALKFDMLHLITGVDFFQPDAKLAEKTEWKPHYEVVYHLSSLQLRHQLVVKVSLPRWAGDVPGQLPEVPSIMGLWRTAEWHEREVFDLSGVRFVGHTDLRRILCPEDWVGHPLRKDYEMPSEYHGIRAR